MINSRKPQVYFHAEITNTIARNSIQHGERGPSAQTYLLLCAMCRTVTAIEWGVYKTKT